MNTRPIMEVISTIHSLLRLKILRREFLGIGYEIFSHMKKHKNNVAQFGWKNAIEETYASLLQKSIRTALRLKSKNLGEDPIIAICASNHTDSVIPLIASFFLRYRVVSLDCTLSVIDTLFLIQQVPPVIMFIDEQAVPTMETAMARSEKYFELVVFGTSAKHSVMSEYLMRLDGNEEETFEPVKVSNKKTAIILFSSGTTGLPKGICLPHGGLLYQTYIICQSFNLSQSSVLLYFTPLYWISSVILIMSCILSGSSRVVCTINEAWTAIDKYKITTIFLSPYLASLLISEEKDNSISVDSVKSIRTAGTKLNEIMRKRLTALFPKAVISQSYGQTELSGWGMIFNHDNENDYLLLKRKPESCGKLLPGFWVKIVDRDTGKIVGPNTVGELCLNNNHSIFMNGYFNRDSSGEYDSEGWLKTGDMSYYDEDKCFYIVGRYKEMLKYRGFHIQPQMVERILETHPAVKEGVVVGIQHEIDGDHLMGIVTLHPDHSNVSAKDLEIFVEARVQERQRLRAGVKIVTEIPSTSTGKPKRKVLKEMVEKGQL
ncbi:hypothetical protein HHI36_019856 [Cryptolaemus montrouzieri]|uniref:Luciferin 4-monooxygenase n=1 Tax=Cryptolaemus montrouzieri TaxID=559131 RepID=A0ABD2N968_9CUCU